jgi:hypothetical protein
MHRRALLVVTQVVAPRRGLACCFSTGKVVPQIHGELSSSDVRSKAMKKRLAHKEQDTAIVKQPDNDAAVHTEPAYTPQYPEQPRPTMGQFLASNFVMGAAMTVGMIGVLVVLRAVGLEAGPPEDLANVQVAHQQHAQGGGPETQTITELK